MGDGLTSVGITAEIARKNFQEFAANTLVIIDQELGQGPIDIRTMSDFGEQEGEALYNIGQQFKKVALWRHRGACSSPPRGSGKLI